MSSQALMSCHTLRRLPAAVLVQSSGQPMRLACGAAAPIQFAVNAAPPGAAVG